MHNTLSKDYECWLTSYYSTGIPMIQWLQSSTREPWWFQYFKLVFLKIPNVITWLVFEIQVINDDVMHVHMCAQV